jgi:hypothetical protein
MKNRGSTGNDQAKGCLSCLFLVLGFSLPVAGFAMGQQQWDAQTGVTIAGVVFIFFMLMAVITAFSIQKPPWFITFLPVLSGIIYAIAPDFIPLPLDDILVTGIGGFFSFILALKRIAPPFVLLSLLLAGVYAWLAAGIISGPVDEAVFFTIVLLLLLAITRKRRQM